MEEEIREIQREIRELKLWKEEVEVTLRDLSASIQQIIDDLRMVKMLLESD